MMEIQILHSQDTSEDDPCTAWQRDDRFEPSFRLRRLPLVRPFDNRAQLPSDAVLSATNSEPKWCKTG